MRINQWIAHNTKFSRREADELIKNKAVKINHKIAVLSDKIESKSRVFINSREIKPQEKYTIIAYHKPKGEIVSKIDDRGRKVVFDSLDKKFAHFIPVGRLDYASSGLLLLTDSVKIANILMKSKLVRIYNIRVHGAIPSELIKSAENGLELKDARAGGHKKSKIVEMSFAPFEFLEIIKNDKKFSTLKVGINEGKNRELRRFFAHFNLEVLNLKRVSYGFIHLNALTAGKSRFLSRSEYNKIRNFLKDNNVN